MNKNRISAFVLAGAASLSLMSGCKKNEDNVPTVFRTNEETYVENAGEYVKVEMEPKIFEPGTHR